MIFACSCYFTFFTTPLYNQQLPYYPEPIPEILIRMKELFDKYNGKFSEGIFRLAPERFTLLCITIISTHGTCFILLHLWLCRHVSDALKQQLNSSNPNIVVSDINAVANLIKVLLVCICFSRLLSMYNNFIYRFGSERSPQNCSWFCSPQRSNKY